MKKISIFGISKGETKIPSRTNFPEISVQWYYFACSTLL